jgi:hypothetical protein
MAEFERMRSEGKYIFIDGGMFPIIIRYVVYRDSQFELIETKEEFRDVFAPITSPEEALGYALAVKKGVSARYNLEYDPKYKYFVDEIEDTHVEETSGGYLLHLFSYEAFGCGPHHTKAVEVEVTTQGDVKTIGSQEIFKDPTEDDLCVD